MSDYKTTIKDLMKQAELLDDEQVEKVHLLEKAMQLADSHQDETLQLETRDKYVKAAIFSDYYEKGMVAYAYMLAYYDKHPEKLNFMTEGLLLGRYKWIIDNLILFPSISKEKIQSVLDDMEQRLSKSGIWNKLQPVYKCRYWTAFNMGDFETADQYLQKYEQADRSLLADCKACTLNDKIIYYIAKEKYQEAIEMSEPILSGELSCGSIPSRFYNTLFIPLLQEGKVEQALTYLEKLELQNTQPYLDTNADCLLLYVFTKNLTAANTIFSSNIGLAYQRAAREVPFKFYIAAQLFLHALLNEGTTTISLSLPDFLPFFKSDGKYVLFDILEFVTQEIERIEKAFNQRNGNDYFTQKRNKLEQLYGSEVLSFQF